MNCELFEGILVTNLGDKIRKLRKDKGWTLEKLAEEIASSKGYVWELENRETKKPSGEKLQKIAEALNVTPDFLLNDKRAEPTADVLKEAYFRKLENLHEDDQQKIFDIIDMWATKK